MAYPRFCPYPGGLGVESTGSGGKQYRVWWKTRGVVLKAASRWENVIQIETSSSVFRLVKPSEREFKLLVSFYVFLLH